jgi:hypothetical protein
MDTYEYKPLEGFDDDLEIKLSIDNTIDNNKDALVYEPIIYSDNHYINTNTDDFLDLLLKGTTQYNTQCTTQCNTQTNILDNHNKNNDNGYDSETDSIYSEKEVNVNPLHITTSIFNTEIYNKPPRASISIRHIWKQAKLGEKATLYQIEKHLIDWANNYATITIKDNNITEISWSCGKTKTLYTTTWNVFIKFILCGCKHHYSQ